MVFTNGAAVEVLGAYIGTCSRREFPNSPLNTFFQVLKFFITGHHWRVLSQGVRSLLIEHVPLRQARPKMRRRFLTLDLWKLLGFA